MSYDMMVFEASAAPREAAAFIAWFEKQTQWNERHEYDDPAVSSAALQVRGDGAGLPAVERPIEQRR